MKNAQSSIRIVVVIALVSAILMTSGCMIGAGEATYKTEIGIKGFKFQPAFPNASAKGKDGATFSSRSYGECGKDNDALNAAIR